MIEGSKAHKLLVGVQVQSPYVIDRRSNEEGGERALMNYCAPYEK